MSTEDERFVRRVRSFIRRGDTACTFASALERDEVNRWAWSTVRGHPPGGLDLWTAALDQVEAEGLVAGLVMPDLRTPVDVVGALAELAATSERWRVTLPAWSVHPRDEVLVGLHWRTQAGLSSSALGLAPLLSMPVIRRAPLPAILLYAGPRANPHRKSRKGEVGFIDMRPPMADREGFDTAWETTRAEVAWFRDTLEDGAIRPDVAFCLPAECRAALETIAAPASSG